MAFGEEPHDIEDRPDAGIQLAHFTVTGLFGYLNHSISFPFMEPEQSTPEILIIEGQNGTGKTTILKMIAGIIDGLNFDPFRNVPFENAALYLSNGDIIEVEASSENSSFPLIARFRHHYVYLAKDRQASNYDTDQQARIDAFRKDALPILKGIDFELITIERYRCLVTSLVIMLPLIPETLSYVLAIAESPSLIKFGDFLREAQVNYRKFFQAEELELLPRILKQFSRSQFAFRPHELEDRLQSVIHRNEKISRFGLQTDVRELRTLENLIANPEYMDDAHALSLIGNYVEIHESKSRARELIATRLALFEQIMDEFLCWKAGKNIFKTWF